MKKAFIQLHIAIFLAGFTGVLGRLISINEFMLVWYRMFFTTILLIILSFFSKANFRSISLKSIAKLFGIGGIIALHWIFFYGSIKYSNVSVSLVCFSSVGFFTSLLDPIISRKFFIWKDVFLGIVVILGIILIFQFDHSYRTGIVLGIFSSFLASLFPILNKKIITKYSPEIISLYEISGGFILLTIALPFSGLYDSFKFIIPSAPDLFWLIILSLFCTVLAFNLNVRALQKINPFTVNLSYNLEPIYGILLAFLLYNEYKSLGWSFFAGISIIILTVMIQTFRVWKQESNNP